MEKTKKYIFDDSLRENPSMFLMRYYTYRKDMLYTIKYEIKEEDELLAQKFMREFLADTAKTLGVDLARAEENTAKFLENMREPNSKGYSPWESSLISMMSEVERLAVVYDILYGEYVSRQLGTVYDFTFSSGNTGVVRIGENAEIELHIYERQCPVVRSMGVAIRGKNGYDRLWEGPMESFLETDIDLEQIYALTKDAVEYTDRGIYDIVKKYITDTTEEPINYIAATELLRREVSGEGVLYTDNARAKFMDMLCTKFSRTRRCHTDRVYDYGRKRFDHYACDMNEKSNVQQGYCTDVRIWVRDLSGDYNADYTLSFSVVNSIFEVSMGSFSMRCGIDRGFTSMLRLDIEKFCTEIETLLTRRLALYANVQNLIEIETSLGGKKEE